MKKYYKFELNINIANILCIVIMIFPLIILGICGFNFESISMDTLFISMIIYFILHELCHGLGYFIFAKDKKNIKFGMMLEHGVLYAMCQEKLNKKAILISLFLPIIILSIIPLPIAIIYKLNLLIINAIFNFAGAIGDILQAILIIKSPKDIEYIDYNNDVGCFLLSKSNLSNTKHFGFKLTEVGYESTRKVDKSIKRIYISKKSYIYIAILIIIIILLGIIGG